MVCLGSGTERLCAVDTVYIFVKDILTVFINSLELKHSFATHSSTGSLQDQLKMLIEGSCSPNDSVTGRVTIEILIESSGPVLMAS